MSSARERLREAASTQPGPTVTITKADAAALLDESTPDLLRSAFEAGWVYALSATLNKDAPFGVPQSAEDAFDAWKADADERAQEGDDA